MNDGMPLHFDPFLMSMQQDLDALSKTFDEADVPLEAKEVYDKTVMEITSICYAISNRGKSTLTPVMAQWLSGSVTLRHSRNKIPKTLEPFTREVELTFHSPAEQHWIQSRIATMPIRVPPLFLELVAKKDARALALLARNLVLLKVVENIWWLHGTGKTQQVADHAITGIQNLMPPEWAWAMEWPLQIILGDENMYQRFSIEFGMG